jgi:transposase-like protein
LKKVYSRGDRTVQAIADELNLSVFTLKDWMKKNLANDQQRLAAAAQRPQDWRPEERLAALAESHGLAGEALQAWCRERGLFPHHLRQWQADFCASGGSVNKREEAQALRTLKAENQRLTRELKRKEQALAEAAALLVLQKKFQAFWGDGAE